MKKSLLTKQGSTKSKETRLREIKKNLSTETLISLNTLTALTQKPQKDIILDLLLSSESKLYSAQKITRKGKLIEELFVSADLAQTTFNLTIEYF